MSSQLSTPFFVKGTRSGATPVMQHLPGGIPAGPNEDGKPRLDVRNR